MIKAPTLYLNETLPDSTRRDALRKNVNRIYLDSWCKQQFTFSAVENDSLNAYAYGNPYALGDGVFSARVLLGLDPDKVPLPQSAVAQPAIREENKILFYPNPASDQICFEFYGTDPDEMSIGTLTLFDVQGKKVYSQAFPLRAGQNCHSLTSKPSPGLYLIQLWEGNNPVSTGTLLLK